MIGKEVEAFELAVLGQDVRMGKAAEASQRVADQGTVILDESGGGVVEVTEGLRERGDGQFDEGFGVGRSGAADRRHGDRTRDQRGLLGKI